jgi:hypothetical protein
VWRPLLLLSVLAGCLPLLWDDVDCRKSVGFTAATYLSKGGAWNQDHGPFAHDEGGAKSLVIERRIDETAQVRITYQRAGKTIVETWTGRMEPSATIHWSGPPDPVFEMRLLPLTADFGAVAIGQSALVGFTVQNRGNRPIEPTVRLEAADVFTVARSTCSSVLAAGASCTVTIAFQPKSTEVATGTVTVTSTTGAPPVTATLTGRGAGPDAGPDVGPPGLPDAERPTLPGPSPGD